MQQELLYSYRFQRRGVKLTFAKFTCKVKVLVTKSCPTLCDPWTVTHQAPLSVGILQASILEWVAMPSSRGSSLTSDLTWVSYISCSGRWFFNTSTTRKPHSAFHFSSVQLLSHVRLFATPWIAARRASLSITNSRSSLKLMSIELVMPSSHLILCHPLLLLCRPLLLLPPIHPSISLFQWVSSSHEVAKVLEFQL